MKRKDGEYLFYHFSFQLIKMSSLGSVFILYSHWIMTSVVCWAVKWFNIWVRLITGELCIHLINQQGAGLISIFYIYCSGNKKITGTFATFEHFVCTDRTNSSCSCWCSWLSGWCACARSMEAVQIKEGCRRHQPTKTVVLVGSNGGSNHPGGGRITPRAFQALMVGAGPTTWSTSIRGLSPRWAALPSGACWPDDWNNKQIGGEILPDYYKVLSNPDEDFCFVIWWCFSIKEWPSEPGAAFLGIHLQMKPSLAPAQIHPF